MSWASGSIEARGLAAVPASVADRFHGERRRRGVIYQETEETENPFMLVSRWIGAL